MHPDCSVINATALKRAIANLRTYDFVGVTEKHSQSLELAHATFPTHFSWVATLLKQNATVHVNVNKKRSRTIDPDVREALMAIGHDHVLYQEARVLFARQWHCYRLHSTHRAMTDQSAG
jgi:hypothetical protein